MRANGRLPIVLVLLDGLGGPAALVGARTPRLDALATRGASGSLVVLDEGDLARFAVLGYRPAELPGRAVLEARGHGLPVDPESVYAIGTLRPSVARGGGRWLEGHAEPRQAALAARMFHLLDGLDPDVRVVPVGLGRAVVAFAGLASDRLSDTGPAGAGPLEEVRPLQRGPLAAGAARRVAGWTHDALRVLQRRRLSALTLRWFGRPRTLPPFAERHGLQGPLVSGTPAFLGAAETIGLEPVHDAATGIPQPTCDGAWTSRPAPSTPARGSRCATATRCWRWRRTATRRACGRPCGPSIAGWRAWSGRRSTGRWCAWWAARCCRCRTARGRRSSSAAALSRATR